MLKKLLHSALLTLACTNFCPGQSCMLEYSGSRKTLEILEKFQPVRQQVSDSLAAVRQMNALLIDLYASGYMNASLKSIADTQGGLDVKVDPGVRYTWAYLGVGNLPELLLSKTGFREQIFAHQPLDHRQLMKLFKRIISESENTGYPFASIGIDSIRITQSAIGGILDFSPGPLITYDSLVIEGASKVKAKWLAVYLDLIYGEPFNQRTIDKIEEQIRNIDFLKLAAPVEITFQNSQAKVVLRLSSEKTNRIDGIVGFLPNAKQNGSLLVTGQFNLDLLNLFGSGKALHVAWQSLKPSSQFLHIAFDHPNILRTPLHLSAAYELLKEDTSFLNRDAYIGFNFNASTSSFSFFTQMKTSRLLSSGQYKKGIELPEMHDFDLNYYGIGYDFSNYDDSGSIRSGMEVHVEAAVGTKSMKKNAVFPSSAYEEVDFRSFQYQFRGSYNFFLPLSRTLILHQRISGAKILNERLFINDLFRVGGLNSLRGFNENYFFASDYLLSNLELQLYFDRNSYAFIFYDQSWVYFDTGENQFEDYPLGLGAGVNFATASGNLRLAYALGKSHEQPLSLRISKFHFGYVAKF